MALFSNRYFLWQLPSMTQPEQEWQPFFLTFRRLCTIPSTTAPRRQMTNASPIWLHSDLYLGIRILIFPDCQKGKSPQRPKGRHGQHSEAGLPGYQAEQLI